MLRSILHCDMNNFYASVECMLDPALKKYPIAVCGSVEERHGIVLAKNYKAKAFDVKTGDAVWQAKQKCKDLVVVPPHYEEYIKYSKLARSVYERYTDQVEPYGMDECWLDISGTESLFGSPEKVANEIRETMKFELGLTISVGVSFNKIFAKLGSDMKKPDAVTVIPKDTFKEKIWGLPAADLLGVGRATQRVLDSYCIRTIGDLANTDPEFLRRRLGKNGVVLWNYANGNDLSLVAKKDFVSPIKSVGHGITTVADLEKPEQVWPVFLELTQDIGHKLRVHGLSAEGVAIHIRDNTLNTRQWQTKIALPTQSPMIIASLIDTAYMVAARLGVVYHHTVAAHQTIDQRLDAHRAQAYLAVADNNTGLHDVTGYDLCLQTGVDNLDVHTAVGELAALKVHPFHLLKDWKDNPGNIEVVDTPVAVAEKRPRCAVYGANHTHSRLPLEPGIHILRQQLGVFLQHLVIIGCRDLEVRSDLPVCDGVDLQRLHGIITGLVVSVEIQPATKRLQPETPGVQHIIGLQIVLPLDFLCHFHKTDP